VNYATAESIRQAHAMELHPSNGPLIPFNPDLLDVDYPRDTDEVQPGVTMTVRVTYALDGDKCLPDLDADFQYTETASDAIVRGAVSISRHADVLAVAVYAGDAQHTLSYPSAIFVEGARAM
jgi:hypothetical protein